MKQDANIYDILERFNRAADKTVLTESAEPAKELVNEDISSLMRSMPREFDAFTRTGELSDRLYDVLFDVYKDEMPYGTAKARTGDPYEWISNRLHQDMQNWKGPGYVDEAGVDEGNAFAAAVQKAKADGIQKGETITVGGEEYPLKEGKGKPDYLDFDKDGDKKEPMKKALKDKKAKQVDEEHPGMFRQVADRVGKIIKGEKKSADESDAETRRLQRQAKDKAPVNEIDINLIKAAQKKAKDEPIFRKDPESERNIGKKYGYRSDADDDSDDDYDEWGERKKKKVHAPAPGEKRGRGRPRKYTADAPRKERVTAKSRKTDRTAWTKKKTNESLALAVAVAESVAQGRLDIYKTLSGSVEVAPAVPMYLESLYECVAREQRLDPDSDFDRIMGYMPQRVIQEGRRCAAMMQRDIDEDYDKDEYDEEGEMAMSQARTIEDAAEELQSILDADENLPEWVQKKISMAKDYIDTARDYLKANRPEQESMTEDQDQEGPADLMAAVDEEYNQPGRHVDNLQDVMNATFDSDSSPEFKRARAIINQYLEFVTNTDVDHYDPEDDDEPKIRRMTHGNLARHIREYDLGDYLAAAYNKLSKAIGKKPVSKKTVGKVQREAAGTSYSAKKARAGKDIGKPGKQFAKIAKSAGERYGSKERGEKVAGAVLAKLRAKEDVNEADMDESALQAYLGRKKYGKAGMAALQQAGREGAGKEKMAKIRAQHDKLDEVDLDEKAVSKAQRAAAGIAYAAKKGDIPRSELRGASKEMARMPSGELKKFAKTKEKGLPQKKTNETTVAGGIAPVMAKEQTVTHGRHKGKQWSPETPGPTLKGFKGVDRGVPSPEDGATAPPKGYKPPKPAAKPAVKKADAGGDQAVAETDTDPTDKATKSKGGMQFGKGIYDSVNRQVEAMISESINISTNISTDGQKSLNISATDEDVDQLMDMLKMAGIGQMRKDPGHSDGDGCPVCGRGGCMEHVSEVTDNEPDYPENMEQEQDAVYMLKTLSGGLNGPKRQSNPNNPADNPLAMKALGKKGSGQLNLDEAENSLWSLYKRFDTK